MSRVEANRREKILKAAARAFSKHGFHKASIKQIAREAKLKSPALIYWYFKDKSELFRALLQQRSPVINTATGASEGLLERPPEEVLPMIAKMYFRAFEDPDNVRMFRIIFSEAIRNPDVAKMLAPIGPATVIGFMANYLGHQIKLGRLRKHDPQCSARCFLGMLLIYALNREIFVVLSQSLPDPESYSRAVIEIFLKGLQP